MLLSIHRLSGSVVGTFRLTAPKSPGITWRRASQQITCHRHAQLRMCHAGRPGILSSLIRTQHCKISVCGRGTLSLYFNGRQIHTSGKKNALPPLVWVVVSYMSKITVALTGRKWRRWLQKQPRHVQRKHSQGIRILFGVLGTFLLCFSGFYYFAHQQVSPITGKKRFITVTRDQYMKVANFETGNYLEEYDGKFLPHTDPLYDKVIAVAQHLVSGNQDVPGMKGQKWHIHIIDLPEKNAFVLPNGHIFVFMGLLQFVDNSDQLGIVLGHEMAHALLLHSARQLSFVQLIDWFVIFGMALIWLLLPNDGIAVVANWFYKKVMDLTVHMPYSRELEEEADLVGFQLAAKACFDVREGSVFWTMMTVADDLKGDGRTPAWLSTHPTHQDRVKNLNQLMQKAIMQREQCNCPRLPPNDPRVRAVELRKSADNVLRARGSKANLKTLDRLKAPNPSPFFSSLKEEDRKMNEREKSEEPV